MTTISKVNVILFGLLLSLAIEGGDAAPAPAASTVQEAQQELADKVAQQQQQQQSSATAAAAASSTGLLGLYKLTVKPNNAEKLKRGLSNFMNQLNPAPFFVPISTQQQQHHSNSEDPKMAAKKGLQPSAEPATIINESPTADVVMKGPNRLAQTRTIGGPLRWG